MSVQTFIAELERRHLLSERVVTKLREAAESPTRTLTANALANFLVQKKHLSERQASDVLNSLSTSGVNLDAPMPADELMAASSSAAIQQPKELTLAEVESSDPEEQEGSSIFAPYLSPRQEAQTQPISEVHGDSFALVPDESLEIENPNASRQISSDDALRLEPMELVPETQSPHRQPESESVDVDEPKHAKSLAEEEGLVNGPVTVQTRATPTVRNTTRLGRAGNKKRDRESTHKKGKPVKGKKQWDSPLILLGGGGLALMLLCGAAIWWLMNRESAEQQLLSARAAVDSGAYSQAIEHYQEFINGNPRHPESSQARVQLAMVRIRQATEAHSYAAAFDLAVKELDEIEDEEDFHEAQGELAALLPQIALGLAQQAEKAGVGTPEATQAIELTHKALDLCNNVTYLPKRMRDEAKLTSVRETLEHVERRQQTQHALDDALKQIEEAIAANDTGAAYKAHRELIKERPELASNPALVESLQKITAAEMAAIKLVSEEQSAETSERPTPWVASLAMANRRIKPAATSGVAASGTAILCIDGAVYGMEAATGRLLWRRYIGHSRKAWRQLIGADVLLADAAQNELLRLDAATGRLIWRQAIGEPFAEPLVIGERGFAAAASGRLYAINMNSGKRTGYLKFAQPLRVRPAADRNGQRLYLTGDQSTLYSISLADFSCLGVFYSGHSEGSISVSPVTVSDKVAILENDGVETCRLRLMSLDDKGAIAAAVAERRVSGLATSPPLVAGRRAIVITDRGQIDVYEIEAGQPQSELTPVATRVASGTQPLVRYAALAGRNIWLGDTQLTKFTILPTGNRLPVEAIENNFVGATFDHPLAFVGETLIHVRRPKNRAGFVATATDPAQGSTLWETELAIPPVGAPIADDSAKAITVASAEGHVFRFDEAALRSRVQDEPIVADPIATDLPALTEAVDLGQGRAAFCTVGSDRILFYNPALGAQPARWLQLESPLACAVSPLADGFVAPTKIGQVFYLSAADGASRGTPFQPMLQPGAEWNYKRAAPVDQDSRQLVIADGRDKIYLVALVDQPQPHLEAVATAETGQFPIESPVIVLGDKALAVGGSSHLVRFQLPSLQPAGESTLPAPAVWGPFRVGDALVLATADGQLMSIAASGEAMWKVPTEHGDLAGAPLALPDSVLVAYKKGILERRSLADGKTIGTTNFEHPFASGPVAFLNRLVVASNDGTLLVVEQP